MKISKIMVTFFALVTMVGSLCTTGEFDIVFMFLSDNGLPPLIITAASMDDISALFAYSLISVPAFENEKAGTLVLVTFAWTVACIAIALR